MLTDSPGADELFQFVTVLMREHFESWILRFLFFVFSPKNFGKIVLANVDQNLLIFIVKNYIL